MTDDARDQPGIGVLGPALVLGTVVGAVAAIFRIALEGTWACAASWWRPRRRGAHPAF
jgi:hypothetical protein